MESIANTLSEKLASVSAWLTDVAAALRDDALAAAAFAKSEVEGVWRSAGATEQTVILVAAGLAVVAAGMLLLSRWRSEGRELAQRTRGYRMLGWGTSLLFVAVFFGWGGTAPLSSAAIASGVVSPEGARKTVEHLEGGIVRSIHIVEGDFVEAGDPLVTLEDVQARANWLQTRERYLHLLATEARLEAEEAGLDEISFPSALTEPQSAMEASEAARAVASQQAVFESRKATLGGRRQILEQRIAQLDEEIAGFQEVIAAQQDQLGLIGRELAGVQKLFDKGLERLPRLLALQRGQAEIRASIASNRANIARRQQQIGETRSRLLTLDADQRERVGEELATVRADLAAVRSRLPSTADALARTVVTAPIDGTVMDVKVSAIAEVVGPGEPILEVVPTAEPLVIEARLRTTDIDSVAPGMPAKIVLTAFPQRNLPQIDGRLRTVSADRLEDERTGEAWFSAQVEVDERTLPEGIELSAGMPADVMIVTGERTMLDYLVEPFIESFTRSFREG
jgi:HlyD family type I secretion membrane fusion protein